MAKMVKVELVDDLSGGKAQETLRFAIDGVDYEIDVNAKNARKFREEMAPYVEAARKVTRSRKTGASIPPGEVAQLRAWAQHNGYQLPKRGRIPSHIKEQYLQTRSV